MLAAMSEADRHATLRALGTIKSYDHEALSMLRLTDIQADIVRSTAHIVLERGGNRSGKSLVGFAIVASVFTGLPLLDKNGKPLPMFIDHPGPKIIWAIGHGEKHIGQTIHRYLFRPGAFKVIEDEKTGLLRAYRPWDPKDRERRRYTKPAPPLISERFLVGGEPVYENRATNVFNHAKGKDGTLLYAYTSTGNVKMGDPVDLLDIDEDIAYSEFLPEWQARLENPWSRMLWHAFPWSKTAALRHISRRAADDKAKIERGELDKPGVQEFQLITSDNPHIDDEVKSRFVADFMAHSREEYLARDRGEFNDDLVEMYPNFAPEVHGCPAMTAQGDDAVDKAVRECGGMIPHNWTIDVIVDPGHSHPAALLCAVPPPELGDAGVVCGEVASPHFSAQQTAMAVKNLLNGLGGRKARKFIIDSHAARQSIMGGGGRTILLNYIEGFALESLVSETTGGAFQFGSDNVEADCMEVRRRLSPGANGRPWLRYLRGYCQKFERQMQDYRKHVTKDLATDKPAGGQESDLCDCIRYWVASNPQYLPPTKQTTESEKRLKLYEEDVEGMRKNDDTVYCTAPGLSRRSA